MHKVSSVTLVVLMNLTLAVTWGWLKWNVALSEHWAIRTDWVHTKWIVVTVLRERILVATSWWSGWISGHVGESSNGVVWNVCWSSDGSEVLWEVGYSGLSCSALWDVGWLNFDSGFGKRGGWLLRLSLVLELGLSRVSELVQCDAVHELVLELVLISVGGSIFGSSWD